MFASVIAFFMSVSTWAKIAQGVIGVVGTVATAIKEKEANDAALKAAIQAGTDHASAVISAAQAAGAAVVKQTTDDPSTIRAHDADEEI